MLDDNLNRIVELQSDRLLGSNDSISIRTLTSKELPKHFSYYLSLILHPKIGGRVTIGNKELDFSGRSLDEAEAEDFRNGCNLTAGQLKNLIFESLKFRLEFILNPAGALARFVFARLESETVQAKDLSISLEGIFKLFEKWDVRMANALKEIRLYFSHQAEVLIKESDLARVLGSAIEKALTSEPPMITSLLLEIDEILQEDPDKAALGSVDFTEPAKQVLASCGFYAYIPAIEIEKEINQIPLNARTAINAIQRINSYREIGLVGAELDDLGYVDEEVAEFTSFISNGIDKKV